MSPTDAFVRVKSFLDGDPDLKKLDPSYTCDFDDSALTGSANGKLFQAKMKVIESDPGSEVEIVVDLPLTLALAKGLVSRTLEKKLGESLT